MLHNFITGYTDAMIMVESQYLYEDLEFAKKAEVSESDLSEEAKGQIVSDCTRFYEANQESFEDDNSAGIDFYLTRNRHGAGFWDGDYPEETGKSLTESSHRYGEIHAYFGDDGKIYLA